MAFVLSELPYSPKSLEPYISEATLNFHHGKHHQAYVNNLNNLLGDANLESKSLTEIIAESYQNSEKTAIFNNAAQVWNHDFFWKSMKHGGGGIPTGAIAKLIERDFGSYQAFFEQFKNAAVTQFGSGWAWLVMTNDDKLEIMKTSNADLPMVYGKKALLTCDVWEHAYYLDYQNRRADFVEAFLKYLANWDLANSLI